MKSFLFVSEYIFNLYENKKQIYRLFKNLRNQYIIILVQTIVRINHEFSLRSNYANSRHSKYGARFLTIRGRA
jgi:hypothetical protein